MKNLMIRMITHSAEFGARSLAVLGFALGMGAWTSSTQAAPLEWAYLWADQPIAASYTPALAYQQNSSGATNTMVRTGMGVYQALLPNLAANAGTVHVTAYGSGTQTCKVASWGPNFFRHGGGWSLTSTQQVNVRCFNASGAPADTRFTLSYANPGTPDAVMAYLWADQPSTASYTPALPNQFNSSGATNTARRIGVGAYTASLPNLGAWAGHVQVTAYGTGSERCKTSNWSPVGSAQEVQVRCFTSSGTPVDTRFTLTYVAENSLIGGSAAPSPLPGTSGSYVWANQSTLASYTPSLSYQWDDFGGTNTVTRSGVGAYAVHFTNHALHWGNVQVTAYGDGSEHCKVAFWNTSDGAQVRCFNSSGLPVDTRFVVALLDNWQGF
jgi:hypothetical protein